jgi:hypothetical protein
MSNSDWWARKMNTPVQPAPLMPQVPLAQPQPATYVQSQQPQYPPSQQMTPQAERCPGCGSGNYGGATPESRKRCYDCGYPLQQSGSGMGTGIVSQGGTASGPAQPSRQVQTGGYNPQGIIGRLG